MQIIKYKWENWIPHLVLKDEGLMKKMPLTGNDISFTLGKRMCIGFYREGKHFPCKNNRETDDKNCNECKLEDDYFFCIRCDGSQCINPKKRDECEDNFYYIYLAAFDSLLKVGISYEYRIMERLVEQGADFGAKIARVKDGKLVREMEQKIRQEINITDRITGRQKHGALFCDPNNAMRNILKAVTALKSNGFAKHMISPEIFDLREHYNLHNILTAPEQLEMSEGTKVKGHAVATKGNLIIFRDENKFYSMNAHDLIGREITMEI